MIYTRFSLKIIKLNNTIVTYWRWNENKKLFSITLILKILYFLIGSSYQIEFIFWIWLIIDVYMHINTINMLIVNSSLLKYVKM